MDLIRDWERIRQHFSKSFSSNFYVAMASVDGDSSPTVTPIGSMILNNDQTGFYFEKFVSKLPKHAEVNNRICVLGVYSGRLFWIKSLFKGKFSDFLALKLYGELGKKRRATNIEISRLNRRMRMTKGLKGNTYLWGNMEYVREIHFNKVEKINLGEMTQGL